MFVQPTAYYGGPASSAGGDPLTNQPAPFVYTGLWTGSSTAVGTNGGYVVCWIDCPVSVRITKAIVGAIGTTGNMEVAIFNQAGTAKLATTGIIAGVASGPPRAIPLTASVVLTPGIYVAVIGVANTSSTVPTCQAKFVACATVVGTFPIPSDVSAHLPVTGTVFTGSSIAYMGFI